MGSSTNPNTCVLCAGPLSATYHNGQHGSWVTWFCPMCDVQRTPTPTPPAPADDASGAEAAAWQIVARDGTPAIAYVSLDSAMEHIGPGETMRPLYAAPLPARREEAVVEARDAERFRWLMSRNFGFAFDAEKCGISTGRWGKWPEEPDAQRAMIDRAIAYYAALRGAKGGDK